MHITAENLGQLNMTFFTQVSNFTRDHLNQNITRNKSFKYLCEGPLFNGIFNFIIRIDFTF